MLAEGNKILINGKEYTLGAKLGGGKEGSVFDLVEKKGAVVKIINDSTMSKIQRNELYAHLKWLYNLGRQADKKELRQYMALPLGLLDDELGYAMLKAGEHDPLNKYITVPEIDGEFDTWYREKYTLKKRYQIIVNLFDALRKIHLSGLIFTDLSPNNIMVHQKQNQIVFIDTDNTRKRTDSYLSVLGTPGYMAPEVYRKPDMKLAKENNIDPKLLANSGRITTESDIFSAAVIAFQLLALWHPFIGDEIEEGTPEDEERALEIKTDYIFKAGTSNTCSYALVPQFEELTTPEIRRLFERTFVDGKDQPALRPTAEEFLEAFQNAFDMIVECPSCGFSRIYAPGETNLCIGCGNRFQEQTMLVIYNVFSNIGRDEVINNIGEYPQYDVALENLLTDGNAPANHVETCRIILEANENKSKYLYLRHFESNTERSEPYAKITLDSTSRMARLEVSKAVFPEAYLIEKGTRKRTALNQGKEFTADRHGIIFDARKHGKGHLQIFGKFVRE